MKKLMFLSILSGVFAGAAFSQTTSFTYQGKLTDAGNPPTAQYDLIFRLFDASGTQIGTDQMKDDVQVTIGIFTVTLDFGESPFSGNTADSLEIAVRPGASTGAYTTLTPRQPLTSSPYSVKSKNTASVSCSLCITDAQISAVDGGKVTGTVANAATAATAGNVSGVVAIANGGTGSSTKDFVDLSTDQSSIGGNKTFNGTLNANIVNAQTQFNLDGNRVLKVTSGTQFTGTDNSSNAFLGYGVGAANTTGRQNSFFGSIFTFVSFPSSIFQGTGLNNTTGYANSFFGFRAGERNTLGDSNTFIGANAGITNVIGSSNTLIGSNTAIAGDGGTGIIYGTAIGAGAQVTTSNTVVLGRGGDSVQVPGSMTVSGSLNANGSALTNLNASNVSSGILPIANGGTGSATPNFVDLSSSQSIGGVKTFSNTVSAPGGIFINNPNTVVITSPNGACWGITVSNTGVLSAFSTPCP